jgi:sterol desaturase/sphingolipid hydroxylase (fatty acid hydroxylase superfamily)
MSERAQWGPEVKALGEATREFAKRHSPWMIGGAIAALVALRVLINEPLGWRDAVAVAAMAIIYPFGEWAIHVYLLHAKPIELRGRRYELPTTRDHRYHHRHPNNLMTLLLDAQELAELLLIAVPVVVVAGGLLIGLIAGAVPVGALISAAIAGYVLVGVYEWTHFLIHTAYVPRSRAYRSIWRNHRLHHFKNEHYWHGITNTIADRVLGTDPDQREVPRSQTARTLDPGAPASTEPPFTAL